MENAGHKKELASDFVLRRNAELNIIGDDNRIDRDCRLAVSRCRNFTSY